MAFALTGVSQVDAASIDQDQCARLFSKVNVNSLAQEPSLLVVLNRMKPKQRVWSESIFSNPQKHDPGKFVYIAHDIFGFNISEATKTIWNKDTPYELNILENPKRIFEVEILSASIITNNHVATYGGGFGLILKVPSENFLAAAPKDMQSSELREALPKGFTSAAQEINFLIERNGLPPPTQVLAETPQGSHNEVLVLGTGPSGTKVEVLGFYVVKRGPFNFLEGQDLAMGVTGRQESQMAKLNQLARDHGLPIIEFQAPKK